MIPPPKPTSEPKNPAARQIPNSDKTNSKGDMM